MAMALQILFIVQRKYLGNEIDKIIFVNYSLMQIPLRTFVFHSDVQIKPLLLSTTDVIYSQTRLIRR